MSIFNSYRLNFYGSFSTDVCTANNDDRYTFVADPIAGKLAPDYITKTDDEIQAELKTLFVRKDDSGNYETWMRSGWNYMGGFATFFNNAKITSFGSPGSIDNSGGDILNEGIYLLGSLDPGNNEPMPIGSPVMVDVDPTGTSCTQWLVGGIQIGGNSNPLLRINQNTRAYSYSIAPRVYQPGSDTDVIYGGFTPIGAIWQMGFEYNEDWQYDEENEQIKALIDEIKATGSKGLIISFSVMEVMQQRDDFELAIEYQNGNFPSNPGLGYLYGTVSVWKDGEIETSVPGRLLNPAGAPESLTSEEKDTFNITRSYMNGYVDLDETNKKISVHLGNSFMKDGFRPSSLDFNLFHPNMPSGPISLQVTNGGATQVIGELSYDPATYFEFGGLADLDVTQDQIDAIKTGSLSIATANSSVLPEGTIYASESNLYSISSENRGEYLDNLTNSEKTITLNISKNGQALTEDVTLDFSIRECGQLAAAYNQYKADNFEVWYNGSQVPLTSSEGNNIIGLPETYNIGQISVPHADADNFTFTIKWKTGGFKQLYMAINSDMTNDQDMSNSVFYSVVRSYPNDDYSSIISAGNIPWDTVYNEVLRYYYVIFPAMSLRFPLNDEKTVTTLAGPILSRISNPYLDTTLYMPITRAMSPGKIALLTAYLNEQISKQQTSQMASAPNGVAH